MRRETRALPFGEIWARSCVEFTLVGQDLLRVVGRPDDGCVRLGALADVDIDAITSYAAGSKREAVRAVRGLLRSDSANFARYEIAIEKGQPASVILGAIESYGPDLVVMGTRVTKLAASTCPS